MAPPPQTIKNYDFIDALRGLAILGVMAVHSTLYVRPASAMLLIFTRECMTGIQLFFIVSAFTLCMSWASRRDHEIFPTRNFFIRRFFRIAPMFYLAIVFYIFAYGVSPNYWAPNGIKWWFIPITALFLHGFHPETITSVVPGGWSIATEMTFYLMLPFLLPQIKSIKSCLMFFLLSLALYKLNDIFVPHMFVYPESQQYLVNSFAYFNFFGQFPVFIIGIFTYLIFRKNFPRRLMAIVGGLLLLALGFFFWYPSLSDLITNNKTAYVLSRFPHHIIAGALFSVFTLLLANFPIRLLVNRVTTTIGKLSFSMYLVHFAVLAYFSTIGVTNLFPETNMASFLHFLCVVLLTAFLSFFFYKCIEQPCIALGGRLITKLEQDFH